MKFTSNLLIQGILGSMLELDPHMRPDMIELSHLLPEKNILMSYFNKERKILM